MASYWNLSMGNSYCTNGKYLCTLKCTITAVMGSKPETSLLFLLFQEWNSLLLSLPSGLFCLLTWIKIHTYKILNVGLCRVFILWVLLTWLQKALNAVWDAGLVSEITNSSHNLCMNMMKSMLEGDQFPASLPGVPPGPSSTMFVSLVVR